jgi:hypothetical protein
LNPQNGRSDLSADGGDDTAITIPSFDDQGPTLDDEEDGAGSSGTLVPQLLIPILSLSTGLLHRGAISNQEPSQDVPCYYYDFCYYACSQMEPVHHPMSI